MGKTGVLGSFEEMVLLAVLHNGSEAYAVTIRRVLAERSGADVAMGAVYATLDRLEEKGLVESEVRSGDGVVGRPRRYYGLAELGISALAETKSIRQAMWEDVLLPSLDGIRG